MPVYGHAEKINAGVGKTRRLRASATIDGTLSNCWTKIVTGTLGRRLRCSR
jgi:hypothetical protein